MTYIFRRYVEDPTTAELELHARAGQEVEVLGPVDPATYDAEVGQMCRIRFADGYEAEAFAEEVHYVSTMKRFQVRDEDDGTWAEADTREEAEAMRARLDETENPHHHVLRVDDMED